MWRFKDHPNFVKVYAFSEKPAAIVLQFYSLGDLEKFIHRPLRSVSYGKRMVLDLFTSICRAIDYMHEAEFVHCDLKPANILLQLSASNSLIPVISDFGISRVLNPSNLKVAAFEVSDIKGASFTYAAPEVLNRLTLARLNMWQAEPDAANWKAGDIYALAFTLLHMLLKKSPWS